MIHRSIHLLILMEMFRGGKIFFAEARARATLRTSFSLSEIVGQGIWPYCNYLEKSLVHFDFDFVPCDHRKFFIFLIALVFTVNINAQNKYKGTDYPKTAKEISSYLSLDDKQKNDLERIIERKENQLEEIASLRNSNLDLYIQKRKNIRDGFNRSLGLFLSENQNKEYRSYLGRIRTSDYLIKEQLSKEGKSEQEIALAIAEN